ncbi:uncharacterized protein [Primulina huaijiensis]|uniref:uncharacterized protein n=1 Tax=Primulina huaijiensis TaxID=1492673 RepID=UPI003CC79A68
MNDMIKDGQQIDKQLLEMKYKAELKENSEFGLKSDRLMTFRGRICVPIGDNIQRDVLIEAHTEPYSIHPGSTKMYQDLRRLFWWLGMKKDIALYISECLTCQQVKFEQQRPAGERKMLRPELVQQMVHVVALIRERMKTAQSRQKSYADFRRRPLTFEIGDHIIGERAYRVALPLDLDRVHNVFHVSMLRKYVSDPTHVLRHEPLDLMPNLSYRERPVQILDRKVKVLRNKEIGIVMVLWSNHVIEEATWEPKEEMKQHYSDLFTSRGKRHFLSNFDVAVRRAMPEQ